MLMDFALTSEERERYGADGFFVRLRAFGPEEVRALGQVAERTASAAAAAASGRTYLLDGNRFVDVGDATVQFEHGPGSATIRVIEPAHLFDPAWEAVIDDPRLIHPMHGLIGAGRIALWTDKLNLKRPREGSGFRWHQDSPYWIHDCRHVDLLPNVMLVLDDASAANGCLRIVPGSHRSGCLPGTSDGSQLGGFFTDPRCVDDSSEVLIEVPAGSLVFFSPHAVHGSGPNRSSQPRRALIVTYQPADHPTLKTRRVRNAG
jgi:hypothetical protein